MDKTTEKIFDNVCRIWEDYGDKSNYSASDIAVLKDISSIKKNIMKVDRMEDEGYSQAGSWTADIRGDYGRNSYGGRRRDSMGRYSGNDGGSYNGNSYRGGYSRASTMEHLEQAMSEATTDKEREAIRRCMDSMR